jgi:hypothetical protein
MMFMGFSEFLDAAAICVESRASRGRARALAG